MRWNLPAGQMPEAWFNVVPHLPEPLAAGSAPGHPPARRPRRPRAAVPDGAHRPGGDRRAVGRHPRRGLDVLRLVAPDAARARAERLERALGTPARIYYKDESVSPAGSHKPNTAVPQAFYNKAEGISAARHRDRRRPVGQRACLRLRLVRPGVQGVHGARLVRPEALPPGDDGGVGRDVVPSPVDDPDTPARSARRSATRCATPAAEDDTHYSLGSVLNHVLLHQTVIGLEAKEQLALAGEERPDIVVGSLRRRVEPRRDRAAVRARRRRRPAGGRAVVVPDAHRGDASSTTSATRPA